MRELTYKAADGRLFKVMLPDDAPDSHASMGIRIGPPDLLLPKVPKALAVRLHNELFHRNLFTANDVSKRRADVMAAWQSALSVDVNTIVEGYMDA